MNLILIISDTFRYDNLFNDGSVPVRTPNLENFAKRAVSLSNLYTSSFPTIPHRTDLTTGRFGWPWHGWCDLARQGNHIPRLLAEQGYVSQLLCDCPHLLKAGFQFGFNSAQSVRGQEGDNPFLRMNQPIKKVMPREKTRFGKHFRNRTLVDIARWANQYMYREEQCFAPRTARLTIEWLEENYQWDPFFLWVDFFDPHEPWDPPEYFVKRYDPDYQGIPMLHPNYGKASDYTPEELHNLSSHYWAETEMLDRAVGRVLEKIDDLQLWGNTVVIFTADHGTSLGEHNRTGKSNINEGDDRNWPLYPEIAHVPCLVAAPGISGGRTVDVLAQPPDILPTMLDLLELEQVESPQPLHGKSLARQIRGEADEEIREVALTARRLVLPADGEMPKTCTPVAYTKRWAYTFMEEYGGKGLYDLATDPLAEKNLIEEHPEQARSIHNMTSKWLEEIQAPEEVLGEYR